MKISEFNKDKPKFKPKDLFYHPNGLYYGSCVCNTVRCSKHSVCSVCGQNLDWPLNKS